MSAAMSNNRQGGPATARPVGGPGGPGGGPMRGGPMGGMIGMPVQKAKDVKGTLRRMLGYLRPYKWQLVLVIALAILSTVFSILGPKIMGQATTKLFEGLIAKMQHVPGASIDFGYIGQILLILIGLYVISAVF